MKQTSRAPGYPRAAAANRTTSRAAAGSEGLPRAPTPGISRNYHAFCCLELHWAAGPSIQGAMPLPGACPVPTDAKRAVLDKRLPGQGPDRQTPAGRQPGAVLGRIHLWSGSRLLLHHHGAVFYK